MSVRPPRLSLPSVFDAQPPTLKPDLISANSDQDGFVEIHSLTLSFVTIAGLFGRVVVIL
jgi:hypothetical protein